MAGERFLVGLPRAWLSIHKRLWYTIKGHSCFKDLCLRVCVFVCLNLQDLARLGNGPVVQTPHYRHSTIVHVVVRTVGLETKSGKMVSVFPTPIL